MALPTPSIYTYRVRYVRPYAGSTGRDFIGYYVSEYSADGGTTWAPIFAHTFQDDTTAQQAIATLVSTESAFQTAVTGGKFLPTTGTIAYP